MSLKIGIVGLPNVGKSTLFNALLKKQQALAANYPFATIDPNVGIVQVPDVRLGELAKIVEKVDGSLPPEVPAAVEFVDIAGIVAGAHKGEGLGNQFLSHIREVDLIAHVVRDFADGDVVNTGRGLVDDYQTIISELIFKDLETVQSQNAKIKKQNEKSKFKSVLEKLETGFNESKWAIEILVGDEVEEVKELFLLTMKPQIVVVNVDDGRLAQAQEITKQVASTLQIPIADVVVVSAKIESELAVLDREESQIFMADLGVTQSGLERLAATAYHRLGLMSFLTAGVKEVRAWTITRGTKAPQAAGTIHTDFEHKFIKAEVVSYEDFVAVGGWKHARDRGKIRLEGKEYIMQDGDVVDFKIGG